jgi:hypothetical protein
LSLFTLTSSQAWRISYFFPKTVTKKKKKGDLIFLLKNTKYSQYLGRLRQEEHEFEAKLDYIASPCLKKTKQFLKKKINFKNTKKKNMKICLTLIK